MMRFSPHDFTLLMVKNEGLSFLFIPRGLDEISLSGNFP